MEILYTTVIKDGKRVLHYARVWVETLQLTFCLFPFPHKGYSYALKQSVIAKGNDCSNVSGSGEYSMSAYSH